MKRLIILVCALLVVPCGTTAQDLDSLRTELVRSRGFIRAAETQLAKTLDIVDALMAADTTPAPAPDPAPDPSPSAFNEPAGMAQIARHDCDTPVPSGWTGWAVARLSTSGGICRVLFPAGFTGGSGPINLGSPFFSASRLYVRFVFRVSGNWDGHSSGVNKIFFVNNDGRADTYFSAQGSGSGALVFQVRTQNVVGGARNYGPNVGTAGITRGTFHVVEVFLDTQAGVIRVWFDGALSHDYTGASLLRSGANPTLDILRWNPTYGGGSVDSVTTEQYQEIDYIHISGSN